MLDAAAAGRIADAQTMIEQYVASVQRFSSSLREQINLANQELDIAGGEALLQAFVEIQTRHHLLIAGTPQLTVAAAQKIVADAGRRRAFAEFNEGIHPCCLNVLIQH